MRAFVVVVVFVSIAAGSWDMAAAEDAAWNGTVGNWSDATRWSSDPVLPNNNGTTFDVTVDAGTLTQDVAGGVTIDNLTWTGGVIAGSESVTVLGTVDWSNGVLANTAGLTVPVGATLNYSGISTGQKLDDDALLNVAGSVVLAGNDTFNTGAEIGSPATVNLLASGMFDIQGDGGLSDTFFGQTVADTAGIFENAGLFQKSGGDGTSTVVDDWLFHNTADGIVEVHSGTLVFGDAGNSFENAGLADVVAGTLQVGGGISTGTYDVADGATLRFQTRESLSGVVHQLDGATINNLGTLAFAGRVAFTGAPTTITGNLAASLSGAGGQIGGDVPVAFDSLVWSGGTIANSGGLTVNSGGSLTIEGDTVKMVDDNGLISIAGSATLTGTRSIENRASVGNGAAIHVEAPGLLDVQGDLGLSESPGNAGNNDGLLTIDGTFRKSSGEGTSEISPDWDVVNNGLVDVESGLLRIRGSLTNNGTIDLDGGNLELLGDVSGAGEITGPGTTTIRGDFHPGDSAAQVDFGGNVEFVGSGVDLFIEIGGTSPGTEFDVLSIDGAAALAGRLRVRFLGEGDDAFAPQADDVFQIITAAEITGSFLPMLPSLPNSLGWEILNEETSYSLRITSDIVVGSGTGDYNGDGLVNAADYVVWRNLEGATGSGLAADGNGDDVIDELDYDVWKMHFGEVVAPSATSTVLAVPEASSLVLALLALGTCIFRRIRGRSLNQIARDPEDGTTKDPARPPAATELPSISATSPDGG